VIRTDRRGAARVRDRAIAAAVATALIVLATGVAAAHDRSVSYSDMRLGETGAHLRARVTRLDLSRLPLDPFGDGAGDDAPSRYVAGHLTVRRGGEPCPASGPVRPVAAPAGWAVFEWDVACPSPGATELTSELFAHVAPSHLHFARVSSPGGAVSERVLTDHERSWRISARPERDPAAEGTPFTGYLALGVEHILSGWDHLAFVVALLLLATSLREVAGLVTAFTLAHSITLALATLGLVRPRGAGIEALIGFSIALVAAENAWLIGGRARSVPIGVAIVIAAFLVAAALGHGNLSMLALAGLGLFSLCHFALLETAEHPGRLRAAVAFGFGLVHGFGFAGVLAEMELPRARLVPALLGFNLGVEAGQLAVVALAWPLLQLLARVGGGRPRAAVNEVGSAAICGLGLYWFLTRAVG
jgi:hypothetical protein